MMAIFMAAVEATIVATAMPTIVGQLGGFHLFSWVFAAYLLAQAVSTPVYGRLADLYGRKRMFVSGATLFLLASTACGFTWALSRAGAWRRLSLFRTIQGLGAGSLQSMATTIVGDIYPPADRAKVQGWLSSVWGLAAIAGPVLGAFIVQHLHWAFVFWINLPIGIVAILIMARSLHERIELRPHQVDVLGSMLADDRRRRRPDDGRAGAESERAGGRGAAWRRRRSRWCCCCAGTPRAKNRLCRSGSGADASWRSAILAALPSACC